MCCSIFCKTPLSNHCKLYFLEDFQQQFYFIRNLSNTRTKTCHLYINNEVTSQKLNIFFSIPGVDTRVGSSRLKIQNSLPFCTQKSESHTDKQTQGIQRNRDCAYFVHVARERGRGQQDWSS